MEKELKDYLEKISTQIEGIGARVVNIESTMATKDDLRKVERKLTKKLNETIEYVKVVDKDISDHRRCTEMHKTPAREA